MKLFFTEKLRCGEESTLKEELADAGFLTRCNRLGVVDFLFPQEGSKHVTWESVQVKLDLAEPRRYLLEVTSFPLLVKEIKHNRRLVQISFGDSVESSLSSEFCVLIQPAEVDTLCQQLAADTSPCSQSSIRLCLPAPLSQHERKLLTALMGVASITNLRFSSGLGLEGKRSTDFGFFKQNRYITSLHLDFDGRGTVPEELETDRIVEVMTVQGIHVGDGLGISQNSTTISGALWNSIIKDHVRVVHLQDIDNAAAGFAYWLTKSDGGQSITSLTLTHCHAESSDDLRTLLRTLGSRRIPLSTLVHHSSDRVASLTLLSSVENLPITNLVLTGGRISAGTLSFLLQGVRLKRLVLSDNNVIWSGSDLEILAASIKGQSTLEELDMSGNRIDDKAFQRICDNCPPSLTELRLRKNLLQSPVFPAGLEDHKSIQVLDFSENAIDDKGCEVLCRSAFGCSKLHSLLLHGNEITRFPKFEASKTLTKLDLSHNRVDDNGCDSLCQAIQNATRLKILLLHSNRIAIVSSPLLLACRHLSRVTLGQNPLISPPLRIGRRWSKLRQYCVDLALGHSPLPRMRLLFVGRGGVGKTTLCSALRTEDKDLPEFHHTLKGLQDWTKEDIRGYLTGRVVPSAVDGLYAANVDGVSVLKFAQGNKDGAINDALSGVSMNQRFQTFRLLKQLSSLTYASTTIALHDWENFSVIDFGGQQQYYATQQLLLSSMHTLYVVVERAFDPVTFGANVTFDGWRYWLRFLNSKMQQHDHISRVPVQLVMSCVDVCRQAGMDLPALRTDSAVAVLSRQFSERLDVAGSCLRVEYDQKNALDSVKSVRSALFAKRDAYASAVIIPQCYAAISECAHKMRVNSREEPTMKKDEFLQAISIAIPSLTDVQRSAAMDYLEGVGDLWWDRQNGVVVLEPVGWLAQQLSFLVDAKRGDGEVQVSGHSATFVALLKDLDLCIQLSPSTIIVPFLLQPQPKELHDLWKEAIGDNHVGMNVTLTDPHSLIPPGMFSMLQQRLYHGLRPSSARFTGDGIILFFSSTTVCVRLLKDSTIVMLVKGAELPLPLASASSTSTTSSRPRVSTLRRVSGYLDALLGPLPVQRSYMCCWCLGTNADSCTQFRWDSWSNPPREPVCQQRHEKIPDVQFLPERIDPVISFAYSAKDLTLVQVPRITLSSIERIERRSAGAYGTVYRGFLNEVEVATKMPHKSNHPRTQDCFRGEAVCLFKLLNVPGVVRLLALDNSVDPGRVDLLVLSWIEGQDLQSHFYSDTVDAYSVAVQIASTFRAMHSLPGGAIIHRDLKPQNVMVRSDGTLFVCDFGCARIADDVGQIYATDQLGTAQFRAPEVMEGKTDTFTSKLDVYSFGCVLTEMFRVDQYRLECPESLKLLLKDLEKRCLSRDPAKRPTFVEIHEALLKYAKSIASVASTSSSSASQIAL